MNDIIVIGGNLAGATAAISAALEGSSVTLIEKNKEPYFPPRCGELISCNTFKSLHLDNINCNGNQINTMIFAIDKKIYTFNFKKNNFVMFDRYFAEQQLLKKAEQVGVNLLLGIKMKDFKPSVGVILDYNQLIQGRIIIDASGIASRVSSQIGLDTRLKPNDIGVCIQSRVTGDFKKDETKWYFHKPYAPFGYAWLFPINDNLANIGLIVPGGQKFDISNMLKHYIINMTNNNFEITSTFRACVPLALPLRNLVKNNVMIVGDAARLSHSITGGGIDNAICSGKLAGKIASKYIHKEINSLEIYQHVMRLKRLRLNIEYKGKTIAKKSDKRYIKTCQGIFSLLYFFNKIFPSFFQMNLFETLDNFSIKDYF